MRRRITMFFGASRALSFSFAHTLARVPACTRISHVHMHARIYGQKTHTLVCKRSTGVRFFFFSSSLLCVCVCWRWVARDCAYNFWVRTLLSHTHVHTCVCECERQCVCASECACVRARPLVCACVSVCLCVCDATVEKRPEVSGW